MSSADNICTPFGPRSEPTEKINFEKKESRRQQKHETLPSMQRVIEGFDARAIRRRAVKCSAEIAQLARTTSALFGYSCQST